MSVILNEIEWAEQAINDRKLGSKPSETIRRVAGYYIDQGYNGKALRRKLEDFLLICDPYVSIPKWSDALDRIIKAAKKYPPVCIDKIDVTQKELDRINAVDGVQVKRLAFALLCLAKYWNASRGCANGWVNTKESEIMKIANVSATAKRRAAMFRKLKDEGMIEFSNKIDNTNVRVLFIDEGKAVLHIYDFRNLGYQYLMYHGGNFIQCECCGITTKILSNRQRYCPSCAMAIKLRQNVESTMRKTLVSA